MRTITVGGLASAALLIQGVVATTGSAATAAGAPRAVVASPAPFQSLASGAATFSGSATDDTGVRSVRVIVTNVDNKAVLSRLATLDSQGGDTTGWST